MSSAKQPATRKSPPPRRASRSSAPIFAIVVGVVVVIGVVAIVLGMSGNDDDTSDGGGTGKNGSTTLEYGDVSVDGAALVALPSEGEDPAVGEVAPVIEGTNFLGEPTRIAPGTPRMVVYLAHWCPHCNAEAPRLREYLETEGLPAGTALTIVPTGSREDQVNWPPSEWVQDMGLGGVETLVDDEQGSAAQAMGVDAYPFIVMLDAQGQVVARTSGEQAEGFFAEAFAQLAASTR